MGTKSVKNQTENARVAQLALAAAALRRSPWFAQCRPAILDSLLGEGRLHRMERGDVLCRQGEPVDHLCVILDGSLEVSSTSRTGKRHVLRYLEPGQLMNLIPVLDEQMAIHDATAHSETLVLLIDRTLFQRAMAAEPTLVQAVVRMFCLRLRLAFDGLSQHALLPLRQRLRAGLAQSVGALWFAARRRRGDLTQTVPGRVR